MPSQTLDNHVFFWLLVLSAFMAGGQNIFGDGPSYFVDVIVSEFHFDECANCLSFVLRRGGCIALLSTYLYQGREPEDLLVRCSLCQILCIRSHCMYPPLRPCGCVLYIEDTTLKPPFVVELVYELVWAFRTEERRHKPHTQTHWTIIFFRC